MKDGKVVCITGAAGYVGEMLCARFAKRPDVAAVIAIDKEPQTDFLKDIQKLTYIQHNIADDGWQEQLKEAKPSVLINAAWQIRECYGQQKEQHRWNVDGAEKVFAFAFSVPSVRTLVHFSTAAVYGAQATNTLDHFFTEDESFHTETYSYAHEKQVAEYALEQYYAEAVEEAHEHIPQVFVVRPAAITGPRGRYGRVRFGLQSALLGNLEGGFVNDLVTRLTSWMPATKKWVRQFIHEDDVVDSIVYFTTTPLAGMYQIFNLTPEGKPVTAPQMAKIMNKRILPLWPFMVRIAFFLFWHFTHGKIPTCPGSWRFYAYPLLMSGKKLSLLYSCRFSSHEAITYTDGRYADQVPEQSRKTHESA